MKTQRIQELLDARPVTRAEDFRRILWETQKLLQRDDMRAFAGTPHVVLEDFLREHLADLNSPGALVALNALVLLKEKLGPRPDFIQSEIRRYIGIVERFVSLHGEGPIILISAPARIELCGGHIDYIDYFQDKVLCFGSREYSLLFAARARTDRKVRAVSMQAGYPPVEFSLDEFPVMASRTTHAPEDVDRIWLAYLDATGYMGGGWENYIKSAVFYFQHVRPDHRLRGMDVVVDSTIPIAGGASSSSALVTSAACAIRLFNQSLVDRTELAVSSGKAEWYVGTRGGNMDHATMAFTRVNHAVLITFQPFTVEAVPVPTHGYSWITFYTTEATKTKDLIVKDGEISAVSVEVLPLLLVQILAEDPSLASNWNDFKTAIESSDSDRVGEARRKIERILQKLPETITFRQIKELSPGTYTRTTLRFPVLYEAKGEDEPMPVRCMAKYHLDEIVRVMEESRYLAAAARQQVRGNPESEAEAMAEVGRRLDATHAGLRDDYAVGTEEVEEVYRLAKSCPGVIGARLMGFGLGGNVLVLVREDRADALVRTVEDGYYRRRQRSESDTKKSICIHTPGPGIGPVDVGNAARRRILELSGDWGRWSVHEKEILALAKGLLNIDDIRSFTPRRPVKPVIFAGGRGTRAKLDGPKVLADVLGKSSLIRVLETVMSIPNMEKPLLILSDHKDQQKLICDAVRGLFGIEFIVETDPQGTGHAMLQAEEALKDFQGTVLVTEGVQAAMRAGTLLKSLLIHEALGVSACTLPTTRKERPYAYLVRDEAGMVVDSRETHLEQATIIDYGEDNVSLYFVRADCLFPALYLAKARNTDPRKGGYRGGALGFPNEMVRSLHQMGEIVTGLCMADPREAKSIKYAADVEEVERFIREMEGQGIY